MPQITNIEIRLPKVNVDRKLVAYADIVLDDCLVIKDLRIIRGPIRHFIQMPNRQIKETGEYRDIVFPITNEFRQALEEQVMKKFIDVK